MKDGVRITKEDITKELRATKKFKPAEGVKFAKYDEYGVPMEADPVTGFDYQKHIVTDEMRPGDLYIEAPKEMQEKMFKPAPGIRRDVDKDPALMTADEREVFQCLEDEEFSNEEDGVYEELEDDFLFLANEGKPALVEVDTSKSEP